MRAIIAATALLAVGLPAVAGSRGAAGPAVHDITCDSPRALRDYHDALRMLHGGQAEKAAELFRGAARRAPDCAMAHWGASRALHRAGQKEPALAAADAAAGKAHLADDRERKLVAAWSQFLKAPAEPAAERKKALDQARRDLDTALSLYPDDPEIWLLRGEIEENALRAGPFYLAAFRLQPSHPAAKSWRPEPPAAPALTPTPTRPVAALSPAPTLFDGLGVLSHPITGSPEARAYYEQGLRCWHSYVTPPRAKNGAGQCFHYAATLDPECAMAYWGLSLVTGGPISPRDAANRALELAQKKGTDRERRFAAARVLELSGPQKREEFLDALDGAILAYPEDVELWIWRGKAHGTGLQSIPYQIAAHRIQPEHPSPNHELVHAYENVQRPALGWPYSEAYRRSAPNMPHANHMQAHLAMRLGRWDDAIDATRMSRKKSLEGFPELDPTHHVDIMIRALAHEGRFQEADAEPRAYRDGLPWARLLQLKADPQALREWADRRRAANAVDGFYIGAIVALDAGDMAGLEPMLANVEAQWKKAPANIYRYNEIRGRQLVQTGQVEEGFKLLRAAAAKAVNDHGLHAWGGGSYLMEVWGEAALRVQNWDEAQEAFHEALAHEHGSIIGALGMQVLWERRGRPDLAAHYAARAQAIWRGADAGALDRQLARLRRLAAGATVASGGTQ